MQEIDKKQFNDAIFEGCALVEFYTKHTPNTVQLVEILTSLQEVYQGKISFYRIDLDENIELAERYGIKIAPAVCLFENGKGKTLIAGNYDKSVYEREIIKLLK